MLGHCVRLRCCCDQRNISGITVAGRSFFILTTIQRFEGHCCRDICCPPTRTEQSTGTFLSLWLTVFPCQYRYFDSIHTTSLLMFATYVQAWCTRAHDGITHLYILSFFFNCFTDSLYFPTLPPRLMENPYYFRIKVDILEWGQRAVRCRAGWTAASHLHTHNTTCLVEIDCQILLSL